MKVSAIVAVLVTGIGYAVAMPVNPNGVLASTNSPATNHTDARLNGFPDHINKTEVLALINRHNVSKPVFLPGPLSHPKIKGGFWPLPGISKQKRYEIPVINPTDGGSNGSKEKRYQIPVIDLVDVDSDGSKGKRYEIPVINPTDGGSNNSKEKRSQFFSFINRHDVSHKPQVNKTEPHPLHRVWDHGKSMPFLDSQRKGYVDENQQAVEDHQIPDREAEIEKAHMHGHGN